MRTYRLVLIILILAGCKASSVVSTTESYSEDLSKYRPVLDEKSDSLVTSKPDVQEPITQDVNVFTKDVTFEIDSINQLLVQENASSSWDGYTIQIYRGNSRSEARQAANEAKSLFPDLEPEIMYYQPTFRVKMGSYFDRIKATKAFIEVKEYFPRALLLPEKLELQANEESNNEN